MLNFFETFNVFNSLGLKTLLSPFSLRDCMGGAAQASFLV